MPHIKLIRAYKYYIDLGGEFQHTTNQGPSGETFSGFISAEYESGEESSCLNGYKAGCYILASPKSDLTMCQTGT